jgi:hypothetical protein
MLNVIRNVETKQVVYISYGTVTHNESGVADASSTDLEAGLWPTTDGWELLSVEVEAPADYLGEIYKMVEDGDTYRWDLM